MTEARLTLLHTSPVHVATFDALAEEEAPGVELVHLVCEELLAEARRLGPDAVSDHVADHVADRVVDAVTGHGVVLCTCSTIGAVAEAHGALRVDRPMAAEAAAAATAGRRVVVLAALESTLAPTLALLAEEGVADVEAVVVDGAWERFEQDDRAGYLALVTREIERHEGAVVVLAQASMAPAATRAGVLSSPRLGLREAVRQLRDPMPQAGVANPGR